MEITSDNKYLSMSNSIGFSNFRRFAKFPEIDLGDVTILVGGNNSGKSTIVKALLLCVDNLRFMRIGDKKRSEGNSIFSNKPVFRFDANELHDVKVKTFARAVHNKPVKIIDLMAEPNMERVDLPSTITFKFTIGQFKFEFVVSGDRDNKKNTTTGDVESITITDLKSNVRFGNNYSSHTMTYEILGERKEESLKFKLIGDLKIASEALHDAEEEGNLDEIAKLSAEIDKLNNQIDALSTSNIDAAIDKMDNDDEVQTLISDIENGVFDESDESNLEKESAVKREREGQNEEEIIKVNRANHRNDVKAFYAMPLGLDLNSPQEFVVVNVIENIIHFVLSKGVKPEYREGDDPNEYGARMQDYLFMEGYRKEMMQDVRTMKLSEADLMDLLYDINYEYISAHAANQNILYNTADRNDYIAQSVHEFYREKIFPGEDEYNFIKKWMQWFEIGMDFEITAFEGEAYQVRIKDKDGSSVPLADKGMGSIQMMILLLRLATILRRNRHNKGKTTIIIEEPEQNLHPKMQSRLADLFHEVAELYGVHFLIETHSEYLVRRTQVIVSEQKYADKEDLKENNPFKIYYLPDDDNTPYELIFRQDGCFENDFGEGFFDEAEKLAFQVL